jgi:ubiquinone biosynthesis protein UbiJ
MATQPPFAFLDTLAERLMPLLQPAAQESRRRLVLLLNHVLLQEPEACARLARQRGRVVEAQWRQFHLRLRATPAGLLDLADDGDTPDLTLTLVQDNPLDLAASALRGDKPDVKIAGDVQFAAEVNWLADHVRWDLEEDLARLLGDAPAHALAQGARTLADAVRAFVARRPGAGDRSDAGGAQ